MLLPGLPVVILVHSGLATVHGRSPVPLSGADLQLEAVYWAPLQGTWVVAYLATDRGHRVAAYLAVDCVPAMHGDGFGTLSVM